MPKSTLYLVCNHGVKFVRLTSSVVENRGCVIHKFIFSFVVRKRPRIFDIYQKFLEFFE